MSYGWLKRTPNALAKAYAESERTHDYAPSARAKNRIIHQKKGLLPGLLEKLFAALSAFFAGKEDSHAAAQSLHDRVRSASGPVQQARSPIHCALKRLRADVVAGARESRSGTAAKRHAGASSAEGNAAFFDLYLGMAAEGSKLTRKNVGAQLTSILKFVDEHPTESGRNTARQELRAFLRLGDCLGFEGNTQQLAKLLDHLAGNADLIKSAIAFSKAWLTARQAADDRNADGPALSDARAKAFDRLAVGVLRHLASDDDAARFTASSFREPVKRAGSAPQAANLAETGLTGIQRESGSQDDEIPELDARFCSQDDIGDIGAEAPTVEETDSAWDASSFLRAFLEAQSSAGQPQ